MHLTPETITKPEKHFKGKIGDFLSFGFPIKIPVTYSPISSSSCSPMLACAEYVQSYEVELRVSLLFE